MNLTAMRAAAADLGECLDQALEMLGREHEAKLTAECADRAAAIAGTYVELARVAIERFEKAGHQRGRKVVA